jgi:hypothetical protein
MEQRNQQTTMPRDLIHVNGEENKSRPSVFRPVHIRQMDLSGKELTRQLNLTTIPRFLLNICGSPIPQQLQGLSWRFAILDAP